MDIFFTEEKLACRIDALAPWRMRDAIKAHGLRMMECPPRGGQSVPASHGQRMDRGCFGTGMVRT